MSRVASAFRTVREIVAYDNIPAGRHRIKPRGSISDR